MKTVILLMELNKIATSWKTNNVVSEQVQHKSGCTVTEAAWKLEISDLKRRESLLSV